MTAAKRQVRVSINKFDGLWLSLAVLAHALLLLIPSRHPGDPIDERATISVSILAPEPSEYPLKDGPDAIPAPVIPAAPESIEIPPETVRSVIIDRPPENRETRESLANTPWPDAAQLIDSVSRLQWKERDRGGERRLGVFVAPAPPEIRRAEILGGESLFEHSFLPAEMEIVDRWLAADGGSNVVVNTASGETLCGRARARDPMNPFDEPVMMYWKCGGGGKRTFDMPQRFRQSIHELRAANTAISR